MLRLAGICHSFPVTFVLFCFFSKYVVQLVFCFQSKLSQKAVKGTVFNELNIQFLIVSRLIVTGKNISCLHAGYSRC